MTAPAGERLGWLAARDDRPAIVEPGRGRVSYAALDRYATRVARKLLRLGAEPGARIGIYTRRSTDAIAVMLGCLRVGCTYVPVDPAAPAARNAEILSECGVHVTIVEDRFAAAYRAASERLSASADIHPIGAVGLGHAVAEWAPDGAALSADTSVTAPSAPLGILYTSGSTGRHKGWLMSREAIDALVRWGHGLLRTSERDVFANFTPFNFGMSLFDIYSSLTYGATLVLVPDEVRQFAPHVLDVISVERVSIWFSTPVVLSLVAAVDDLEARDLTALRVVVFGGEVCPAPPLRTLRRRLTHPRYLNCWGSTETNIGTHYELPAEMDFDAPPPIGRPCAHYTARVIGLDGEEVAIGSIGELQLRGPGLHTGYLNQPDLSAERMIATADGGPPWFRTCDLVIPLASGDLRYAGRIGRMVKLRGYRVEPGEIETRLYEHPHIREASVVPVDGPRGIRLVAHLSGARLPIVELKEFCAAKLPAYMIPERFVFHAVLPRTSRGKVDFEALRATSA